MAPVKPFGTISQEAFDSLVKENMEDLGMEPHEALEDAIQALTIQGVDLAGIIKCIPGGICPHANSIRHVLDELRPIASALVMMNLDRHDTQFPKTKATSDSTTVDFAELLKSLDRLHVLCSDGSAENACIASQNGGVEVITSICGALPYCFEHHIVLGLKILASILHDYRSSEVFRNKGGPKIMIDVLKNCDGDGIILDSAFAVIAASATGNEVLKESFIELDIGSIIIHIMSKKLISQSTSLYDAIRVLLTPDDGRVLISQVYGYARKFDEAGITGALVDAIRDGPGMGYFIAAGVALKALAVNDDICKSISGSGGIGVLLHCIDESVHQNNKKSSRICCSLLSKLAGNDANKSAVVEQSGFVRLITLASKFSGDPHVLQEVMSLICVIALRSPENAAKAVENGAGDLAIEAMQRFPAVSQLQKQACLMIRNLVVRNPENRAILLNNGIEIIIRKAKQKHKECRDAAVAALRDLGLDNYI